MNRTASFLALADEQRDRAVVLALREPASTVAAIFERYALGYSHETQMARHIAVLRHASYIQRLNEIGKQIGVKPGPVEKGIAARQTRHIQQTAAGVIETHNRDLRCFLECRPADLNERQLSVSIRQWERERNDRRARQIAVAESSLARNQAMHDFLLRNPWTDEGVHFEVIPHEAAEEKCAELIDRGWMTADEIGFVLPLHIGCVHELQADEGLRERRPKSGSVWLGSRVRVGG